jgi:putative peptidoglycan lipid II flippase
VSKPITEGSGGIGRASALLASGTLVSRVLGFLSGVVLARTIGIAGGGADAFAVATQLPSNIYAVIAGGLFSAVFVPAIVRAGLHEDGGQKFINRLVTLGVMLFAAAAIAATFAAPWLVSLYASPNDSGSGSGFTESGIALATAFAYWCLPQVFFYALYSLLGEVLNARGVFGPFTWAPAVNNVVMLAGLVVFSVLFGSDVTNVPPSEWSTGMIALLAGSGTLGVALQSVFLMIFWKRAGLSFRLDFHFRGVGLGAAGKAAAWTFGMVLVTQIAGIVQTRVASLATTTDGSNASVAILKNTWLIFMLPHSLAAVSIATAYFTRMSTHVRDGRLDLLRTDLSASTRSVGLIVVFASVGLSVLAYPFSAVFSSDFSSVSDMAPVLIAFLLGLVPFSMLFVLRRGFYALEDTKTPFFITVFQSVIFVIGALIVALLPVDVIALGIAVVTTIAGIAQTALSIVLLRRKLGNIDGKNILRRHVQFFGAAIVAGAVGLVIVFAFGSFEEGGFGVATPVGAIVTMAVAGTVMLLVYAGVLRLMHNPELSSFIDPIMRRIRR